jgi:hypothetical protein
MLVVRIQSRATGIRMNREPPVDISPAKPCGYVIAA